MIHSPIHKNRAMFIPDVRRPNMTVEILQITEDNLEAHEHPDTLKSGELHKSAAFTEGFAQYKAQYSFSEDLT